MRASSTTLTPNQTGVCSRGVKLYADEALTPLETLNHAHSPHLCLPGIGCREVTSHAGVAHKWHPRFRKKNFTADCSKTRGSRNAISWLVEAGAKHAPVSLHHPSIALPSPFHRPSIALPSPLRPTGANNPPTRPITRMAAGRKISAGSADWQIRCGTPRNS